MRNLHSIRVIILSIFTFVLSAFAVNAQTEEVSTLKSRLAVVATETKTNIWVSDFPKATSVVIFDEEDNLISIVSTNEFGAAFLSLPKSVTKTIIAKTMNGEISVSNKAKTNTAIDQNIAINSNETIATKA